MTSECRYDFMSDMVYVFGFQTSPPCHESVYGFKRFGGGSEQMRGGDRGNIWAIADKGAEWVSILSTLPLF